MSRVHLNELMPKVADECVTLETFRSALDRERDFAVLCGAGLSMIPPTHLPSGEELRDLCVVGLLADDLSRPLLEKVLETPAYKKLLPEITFQQIATTCEAELDAAMTRILGQAVPNVVHARLAQHPGPLFTTNFDLCLEHAGATTVGHLHGTIEHPASLQNRIFRLGRTAGREFDQFRAQAAGRPLLVLGYSFRDRDIIELVRETQPGRLYFLSYDGALPETIKETGIPCTYAQGAAQDLFSLSIDAPAEHTGNKPSGQLPRPTLAARANALLRLSFTIGRYDLGDEVARLYLPRLRGRARLKALAELANQYRVVQDHERAIAVSSDLLRHRSVRRPENADIRSSARVHLGLSALDRGSRDFGGIERHFLTALEDVKIFSRTPAGHRWKTEISIWRARIYNNLGMTYAEWGRYQEALRWYRRSYRIKRIYNEEVGMGVTLNNVAKVYLRHSRYGYAARTLRRVLAIGERLPDPYLLNDALTWFPRFLADHRGIEIGDNGDLSIRESAQSLTATESVRLLDIAQTLTRMRKKQLEITMDRT